MYKDAEKRKAYQAAWNKGHSEMRAASRRACRAATKRQIATSKIVCVRCGYNKCKRALSFHHKDGENKDSAVSRAALDLWSAARLAAEIAKCDVLCANCHMEDHCQDGC